MPRSHKSGKIVRGPGRGPWQMGSNSRATLDPWCVLLVWSYFFRQINFIREGRLLIFSSKPKRNSLALLRSVDSWVRKCVKTVAIFVPLTPHLPPPSGATLTRGFQNVIQHFTRLSTPGTGLFQLALGRLTISAESRVVSVGNWDAPMRKTNNSVWKALPRRTEVFKIYPF